MKKHILSLLLLTFVCNAFAQVPSYVPTDGLVGYWPFNGDAADESGNGNDGTVNGATLTNDRNGVENAAYSFDGVNDYISLSNAFFSGSTNVSSFTFVGWFNASIIPAANSSMSISTKEGFWRTTWIGLSSSATISQGGSQPSPQGYWGFGPANPIQPNAWNFFCFTFHNGVMHVFLNGVESATYNNPYSVLDYSYLVAGNSTATNLIGASGAAAGYNSFWNGKIDDFGYWNRVLTVEEMLLLYTGCTVEPTAIVGENAPLNFTTSSYFCNDNPGSTYEWTVTNGVISSGQGTNSILVLWGNEGEGTVTVVETNAEGCQGQAAVFNVSVQCSSNITTINGSTSPIILSPQSYSVDGPEDSEYVWSVTNGVIASGQGTNTVNVIWAAEGEGTLSVIETTSTGCESPIVTLTTNAVVTDVNEFSKINLLLYPNPASDRMTLQCGAEKIGEEYIIYDALGKIVMRGTIINTQTTLNISELSSGEYFIKINEEVMKAVKE